MSEPRLRLPATLPPADARHLALLLACARNLGIGVSGTRGIGKTQLLRLINRVEVVHFRKPTILVDPVGSTIDGLLSMIPYYRREDEGAVWSRIR